jgi:polyisoprenoid-binding protein YceI
MKIRLLAAFIISICTINSEAQKYFTKNGKVSFFSKATLENIKADNNQVTSTLNTQSGELLFSLLTNAFHFEKALMEEHFNDDYIESAKYPRATFKGTITNIAAVNTTADGSYPVTVSGDLTIHGVTKNISTPATITVKQGKISGSAVFNIKPADYNISIPAAVRNNIAETIQLTISCTYEKRS